MTCDRSTFIGCCWYCGQIYDECRCPDRKRRTRLQATDRKKQNPDRRLPGGAKKKGVL